MSLLLAISNKLFSWQYRVIVEYQMNSSWDILTDLWGLINYRHGGNLSIYWKSRVEYCIPLFVHVNRRYGHKIHIKDQVRLF